MALARPFAMVGMLIVPVDRPEFPDGVVHHFGKVRRGAQLKHSFRIVNTSEVPIELVRARWSCSSGALNAQLTRNVLRPGEEARLEIVVDSRRFLGPRTQNCCVEIDNGRMKTAMRFQVTADSREDMQP
jgi:Protein of unknown function (DUF1573)